MVAAAPRAPTPVAVEPATPPAPSASAATPAVYTVATTVIAATISSVKALQCPLGGGGMYASAGVVLPISLSGL
ncbi:hypothetical protein [Metallibacterium scheffleri]|uniref:hypothetical protein n=1 Tax=Metallibacterium scheffleri TaxID=993689 RepID=UPI0023F42D2D|nr:hypothetical protein [Metallibacterium scheffleri]